MIKPAVVLRINLRIKKGRRAVGVLIYLEGAVMASRIGNTNAKKK